MKKLMTLFFSLLMVLLFTVSPMAQHNVIGDSEEYVFWNSVGKRAAEEGLALMKSQGVTPGSVLPFRPGLIAMTNAGFVEIAGRTTEGSLDGLAQATGVSRGRNSLVELHSHPEKPLFFAVYDKESGLCAYLEVNPDIAESIVDPAIMNASDIFTMMSVENIKPEHVFANAPKYADWINAKIFGGYEFPIFTILNAVAAGAPVYVLRSVEFHDHYCGGVTSGIMMAQYVKRHFSMQTPSDRYFVQGIRPWCKEDALMVMLNATPGKSGYAVTYPTAEDIDRWWPGLENASSIIYRQNGDTGMWEGMVLGYTGGDTGCPDYGHRTINQLCGILWNLEQMDNPENFVNELLRFEMPEGTAPRDWARPGFDIMKAQ